MKESDIIVIELLPPGQAVLADRDENYEPATVLDHAEEGYLVKYEDDQEAR